MKSFIIAIIIATIMITGSITYTINIEKISDELSSHNERVIKLIEDENFDAAMEIAEFMDKYIDDKKIMLAATGDHEDIDKMEIYLSELTEYIKGNHKSDALAHAKALKTLFEHLPKNYRLKPENIL